MVRIFLDNDGFDDYADGVSWVFTAGDTVEIYDGENVVIAEYNRSRVVNVKVEVIYAPKIDSMTSKDLIGDDHRSKSTWSPLSFEWGPTSPIIGGCRCGETCACFSLPSL